MASSTSPAIACRSTAPADHDNGYRNDDRLDLLAGLVLRARAGDQLAWRTLHDGLHRMVLSVVRGRFRIVGPDAEDVAQAAWLRIAVGIGRLDEPRSVVAWVTTIAARESLRYLAAAARREVPVEEWWTEAVDLADDPVEAAVRRDDCERVARAVAELTPWSATVLRLVADPTEPTHHAMADRLGVPRGSVGFHKRRALDELRGRIEVHAARAC